MREEEFKSAIEKSGGLCVMCLGCMEKHGQHLPKGQYRSVEENAGLKILETDTETVVEFELSAFESLALYRVEEE